MSNVIEQSEDLRKQKLKHKTYKYITIEQTKNRSLRSLERPMGLKTRGGSIHRSVHAWMHASMHKRTHTYIHTYTHIYIYIYIYTSFSATGIRTLLAIQWPRKTTLCMFDCYTIVYICWFNPCFVKFHFMSDLYNVVCSCHVLLSNDVNTFALLTSFIPSAVHSDASTKATRKTPIGCQKQFEKRRSNVKKTWKRHTGVRLTSVPINPKSLEQCKCKHKKIQNLYQLLPPRKSISDEIPSNILGRA